MCTIDTWLNNVSLRFFLMHTNIIQYHDNISFLCRVRLLMFIEFYAAASCFFPLFPSCMHLSFLFIENPNNVPLSGFRLIYSGFSWRKNQNFRPVDQRAINYCPLQPFDLIMLVGLLHLGRWFSFQKRYVLEYIIFKFCVIAAHRVRGIGNKDQWTK